MKFLSFSSGLYHHSIWHKGAATKASKWSSIANSDLQCIRTSMSSLFFFLPQCPWVEKQCLFRQILIKQVQASDNFLPSTSRRDDRVLQAQSFKNFLPGNVLTATIPLVKVNERLLNRKVLPFSVLLPRMEICPPCQLWISLSIRNNTYCNINLTRGVVSQDRDVPQYITGRS